jgi:hypothetical protein
LLHDADGRRIKSATAGAEILEDYATRAGKVKSLGLDVQLLYKPFSIDDLEAAIRRAIDERSGSPSTRDRTE